MLPKSKLPSTSSAPIKITLPPFPSPPTTPNKIILSPTTSTKTTLPPLPSPSRSIKTTLPPLSPLPNKITLPPLSSPSLLNKSTSVIVENKKFTGNKDIDYVILKSLDDRSLFTVCQANKYLRELCNNETFWKTRFMNKFPEFVNREYQKWKELMHCIIQNSNYQLLSV